MERAIDAAPDLAEAHNLRGMLLEKQKRKDEALAAYQLAVELDPAFVEAGENLSELSDELRQQEEAAGPGQETDWKSQLTAREGIPTVSRGWKIVLAPVFLYLLAGTGVLFLVYELERLAYALAYAVEAPGMDDETATEWHMKDLRFVIAFPFVAPVLGLRGVALLLWATLSALGRGISIAFTWSRRGVQRLAAWLIGRLALAWRWTSRWAHRLLAWIGSLAAVLWRAITRPIVAIWAVLMRAARAAWRWLAVTAALAWDSLVIVVTVVAHWFTVLFVTLWRWTIQAGRAAWRWLAVGIAAIWEAFARAFTAVARWLVGLLTTLLRWMIRSFRELWRLAALAVNALWTWLVAAFVVLRSMDRPVQSGHCGDWLIMPACSGGR